MKINNSNESLMNYTQTDTNLKYNLHIIGNGLRNVLKNYKVYFLFNFSSNNLVSNNIHWCYW
jgi:hypothetical protein